MSRKSEVPAVTVDGLRVELSSGADIVSEVSFAIRPGRVLGLVGESGSGKTTVGLALLHHVRRGSRMSDGEITIDGRTLTQLSEEQVQRLRGQTVAYIPQDPATALNPALRVGRQLTEMLEAHNDGGGGVERQARLQETLADVALPAGRRFLRRYPHQLSGGQQQRVAIAMAFICRPRVIICDEPTTALDVTTQAQVLETIRRLCSDHDVAIVYISHDLAVISGLADEVAVMYAGRIVEQGPRNVLFSRPRHPYTRALLAAVPDLAIERPLSGIPGLAPLPGHRPSGCFFAPRCPLATEVCAQRFPPTAEVGPAHQVRCHHHEEVHAPAADPSRSPPAQIGDVLLRVRDLDAHYGSDQVLFDVQATVRRNECVALVGQSGSGKTTLARCIAGLHPHYTGTIALDDHPLAPRARERPRLVLQHVQYIFQNPYASLNPRRTVGQTIARRLKLFGSNPRSGSRARVAECLERVALSPALADRYPDELSGGERQRVAVARALAAEPELLICDEITSALDVSVQAAIVELLQRLRADTGLSMLFITHNLALIRDLADQVIVMAEGRVVETGTTVELLAHPVEEHTARLVGDTPSAGIQA
jgi:peptide/nickel transport system ATP-binding protein